jgi:hypothetical protein
MKIYYFDIETGIFQGEDFADEGFKTGDYMIPSNATTLPPPPYKAGLQLLIFDVKAQNWQVCQVPQDPTRNHNLEGMALDR